MMSRRSLIQTVGVATLAAATPLTSRAASPGDAAKAAQARLAQAVRAYDAQGIHRTATQVDADSARWLADALRASGIDAAVETFTIDRVDLGDSFLETGGRQLGGVPLFDAAFTDASGIGGRLGPIGGNAEIGVLQAGPLDSTDRPGPLRAALDGKHKAIAVITNGGRAGLSLINASRFLSPAGVPALQLSSVLGPWLISQAAAGATARLVASATRRAADALNVVGTWHGRDPNLAPLVVMTPRSGWWNCAGERGGGIAAWLETARAVASARPARSVHFLASSGHELGQIGLDAYLAPRPGLARQAALWVHFGANIGAGPAIRLQSADPAIQQQAVAALAAQGLQPRQIVPPGIAPGGEAGTIFRLHGRYVSLQGDNALFHNPADRWPEAIDIGLAAKQALAFAGLVTKLAAG